MIDPTTPLFCAARDASPPHTAVLEPALSIKMTSPTRADSIAVITVPQSHGLVLTVSAGPVTFPPCKTGHSASITFLPSIASAIIGVETKERNLIASQFCSRLALILVRSVSNFFQNVISKLFVLSSGKFN